MWCNIKVIKLFDIIQTGGLYYSISCSIFCSFHSVLFFSTVSLKILTKLIQYLFKNSINESQQNGNTRIENWRENTKFVILEECNSSAQPHNRVFNFGCCCCWFVVDEIVQMQMVDREKRKLAWKWMPDHISSSLWVYCCLK